MIYYAAVNEAVINFPRYPHVNRLDNGVIRLGNTKKGDPKAKLRALTAGEMDAFIQMSPIVLHGYDRSVHIQRIISSVGCHLHITACGLSSFPSITKL